MTTLADNALTTLAAVKGELNISSSDHDSRLARYINEGSALFERVCNCRFYHATDHVERVESWGDHRIAVVDHLPIDTISSIKWNDGLNVIDVDADYYEVLGDKDAAKGWITRVAGSWSSSERYHLDIEARSVPGTAQPNYVVTYTGGWITPKQEDDAVGTRTLPWDIEGALIDFAAMRHSQRGSDKSVARIGMDDGSISYITHNGQRVAVPASFKAATLHYMRRAIA